MKDKTKKGKNGNISKRLANVNKTLCQPMPNVGPCFENIPTFELMFAESMNWSLKVFPKSTWASCLVGLSREISEVIEAKDREQMLIEYVDCMIYLLSSMANKGYSVYQIQKAFYEKLKINLNRTWKLNSDKTYSHEH